MSDALVASLGNLLFIGASGCFLAYWAIWARKDDISRTGALVKACAVGLSVPLLLIDRLAPIAMQVQPGQAAWFLPLMALGLACGAVGDFALARKGERAFLSGMAAFAFGHLVYAYALWRHSYDILQANIHTATGYAFAGLTIAPAQIAALAALVVLQLSTEIWLAPRTGTLRWPVRGYVVVIGIMASVTILLFGDSDAILLRLGVALFVLSDLLLALRLFVVVPSTGRTVLSLLVWPCYWLGQMLIAVGAMFYASSPWF